MINYSKFRGVFLSIGLLLLSTGFLISGCALMNTLVSLKLQSSGETSILIGIIAAVYFTGMLIGSLKISQLIGLVGYVKSFTTLASVMAITIILPGINENIYLLSFCRFLQGFSLAGLYVVIESWILCASSDDARGKTLAIYMIVIYASYAFGQFFLSESTINTIIPFCISTILVTSSIIPLSSFPVTPPILEEHDSISIKKVYNASPSGFVGCFISGIFTSAVFSIFPLYIKESTNNTKLVSIALAINFLAGVSMQYPLGILSDKMDRQKIQILLNLVFTILLTTFAFLEYTELVNFYVLIAISIVIGMFSFTIYPISINLVCDNLKKSEIICGTERITVAYGIGSIIGPIYTSFLIKILGLYGYHVSYLTLTAFLSLFTIFLHKKSKREKQIPIEEIITPFVPYHRIDPEVMPPSTEQKASDNKVD